MIQPTEVADIVVKVMNCACGNSRLMLILPCEVYCPKCCCVVETLRWHEIPKAEEPLFI